jgi:hypothetical protein
MSPITASLLKLCEMKGEAAMCSVKMLQINLRDAFRAILDAYNEYRTAKQEIGKWDNALAFHRAGLIRRSRNDTSPSDVEPTTWEFSEFVELAASDSESAADIPQINKLENLLSGGAQVGRFADLDGQLE